MARETSFRRWRKQVGFTQDEAADALGISKSQVANFDAGKDRASGRPATPPLAVRSLMTAIAMGQVPQPWPE
ncbi:MAG: hypothetical protein ABS54_10060 [Hyphomicrobium sp. SCN 65-11]|mgnify:CR=1 FL=1|nr:MAG: hypothetical protein ABS54_10060 [Hyphomicrobium sp. SCN 65-11]